MKKITCLLLFLLSVSTPALCQEFLTAKVLAVDPESLEITVVSSAAPDTQLRVRVAEENNLPRDGEQLIFPGCVSDGATIRLWGSREEAEGSLFLATDIRGCRSGGCSDPTGVRSRLRKMREHLDKSPDSEGPGANRSDFGNHGGDGHGNGGGGGGNR